MLSEKDINCYLGLENMIKYVLDKNIAKWELSTEACENSKIRVFCGPNER